LILGSLEIKFNPVLENSREGLELYNQSLSLRAKQFLTLV